jgi:hypothetical protein
MSHITTIKTKVLLKDEGILKEVLAGMQRTLPNFMVQQTTAKDGKRQILVRYPPIETFQRKGNLRFVLKDGAWEMQGDDYSCRQAFKAVTDQVLVGYQQAALQRILIRNRYTTQTQAASPAKVTMHARRF